MTEFWQILEADLNYPIPSFIKNGFTMAGYGHPIAFKAITDEHILNTEQFVREKTLHILQQNLHDSINEQNCEVLVDDDQLRDYFGDLYAHDPATFKFEAGDVLLIKELVEHVKSIADRNGKNTDLGHFAKPKTGKKNRRKNAHLFPEKKEKKKKVAVQLDESELKSELQQKAMACFNLHLVGTEHNAVNLEQVIVEIHTESEKFYGEIFCVFCKKNKKPKRVSFNETQGNGCWILSNLVTHLQKVHHSNTKVNTDEDLMAAQNIIHDDTIDSTERIVQNSIEINGNESVIIVEESNIPIEQEKNIKRDDPEKLYTQLSSQITEVTAAVLKNADASEEIKFTLNKSPKKLSVATIPGDGSCLFGALAHQLWKDKIKSRNHVKATKKLRAEIVEHILNNFSSFEHHLKDRVYELKSFNEITDMSLECKLYARHVLSNPKVWGGVETLLAVSSLYSTNVVVFNEDGICTNYKKTDQNVDRSIAIAHRFGLNEAGEKIRNHYDSIFEATSADLYAVACYIAK